MVFIIGSVIIIVIMIIIITVYQTPVVPSLAREEALRRGLVMRQFKITMPLHT